MPTLTAGDFQSLLSPTLPKSCLDIIASCDWGYENILGDPLHRLFDDFVDRLHSKAFTDTHSGKTRWIAGWAENRDAFIASQNTTDLIPKYIRPDKPMRLMGRFIQPHAPDFEWNWYRLFQTWIFETQLAPYDSIYEFGCGSGVNLARFKEMAPHKHYVGLDWVQPAVDCVKSFGCEGRLFDFNKPDYSINLPQNTAVFTFGALEQVTDATDFITWCLVKKPALCVFVEPIYEYYNKQNLADYLAIRAHEIRGFVRGLSTKLHALLNEGAVNIGQDRRAHIGSLVLEGYSRIVWRPTI